MPYSLTTEQENLAEVLASSFVHIASPASASTMTGQVDCVDGGLSRVS